VIFGGPIEQTRGRFVAFRLEELVRHALFDVVRLTRKDHEGLVLRLPAEPRDAAVIAARVGPARSMSIWSSANSHGRTTRTRRRQVGHDRRVRDLLDQAGAEYRRWDAKDQIIAGRRAPEVWLGQDTSRCIGATSDCVE